MKRSDAIKLIWQTYDISTTSETIMSEYEADKILQALEKVMKPYRIIESETEFNWLNDSDVIIHKIASLSWEPEND